MPQKPLLTPKELSQGMAAQEADVQENLPAILDAIERATSQAEAAMFTTLRAASFVDVFQVHDRSGEPLDGFYRLTLKAGYLHEAPTVTYGDSLDALQPLATPMVDRQKGVLLVPASMLGKYIRASYRAGFLSSTEVPAEVRHVIFCLTPSSLLSASGNSVEAKVLAPAMDKATVLQKQGLHIASSQDRRVGAPIRPLTSERTPLSDW